MKINLLSSMRISDNNLSMSQTILFHYISSENTSAFSVRLAKHFGENQSSKEDALIALIKEIEDFQNGIMFLQGTKRKVGAMLKPFNYTLKPFLADKTRGSEDLISSIDEDDKGYLQILKQAAWGVLIKLY